MKRILPWLLAFCLVFASVSAMADTVTYPLVDAKPLTFWAGAGFQLHASYATGDASPFHSGLITQTGVPITWQFIAPGTDANQAFNLMLAGSPLPDIVFYERVVTNGPTYLADGIARDLTEHIQEWSPNYYAWLQSHPEYDKAMKTDDGKYFVYGFFREAGGWNDTYLGPVVRQDWLDEQGLTAPVTIAEWTNVITVFKEKYNAPLSFSWTRFRDAGMGIQGAFGAYGNIAFQLYIDADGKVQCGQTKPEWRDYMGQLAQWWAAGLIDQDVFSLTDSTAQTKAINGEVGISYTSMGQLSNWSRMTTEANPNANWVGLQYPRAEDGTISQVFGGSGIGMMGSFISTSCPDDKLETAMRLLDYAYSEEGNLYWNYGTQGVSWDYDAEGKPAYLPLVTADPDGLNDAIAKFGGSTWSGSCIQSTALLYMKNRPVAIAANDLWFYPNEPHTSDWKMPSGVALTADEKDQVAFYQASIDTFVSESAAAFITGSTPITEWDNFVKKLEGMGLAEILKINQAAYDRFLTR